MSTSSTGRASMIAAVLATVALFTHSATAVAQPVSTLKVTRADHSKLQLGDGYELRQDNLKRSSNLRALSLVGADVDGDGFPDLVSGYASVGGGVITLHRGNREAWAPSTPESLALVAAGSFPPGFESVATEFSLPVAPDFMVSGDFNGDGRADIVIAQRGDRKAYFLAGQRTGFAAPMQIKLDGGVDALAAGRVDSRDGFPKLLVAVSGTQGASLLTFAQGMYSPARPRALPAPVEALAVGKLSADSTGDIVMLSAGRVHVVHGTDALAASAAAAPLDSLAVNFSVRSFTLGEFIWDRTGSTKIALLADDGAIHVAARADIDTRPFTVDEVRAKRREQQSGAGAALKRSNAAASAWQFVRVAASRVGPSGAGTGLAPKLLRARLSNLAADDILVIDALKQTVDVLTDHSSGRKRYSVSASVSASQAPVAALSLQTSAFVLPSLVVLGQGAAAPSVAPPVPLAVFTVTKTADTNDGTCNADCSLREAIGAANAAGGAHTINVPAGTYTLTIANTGGLNEDNNAQGDLDINNNMTIVGAGAATTIIQAGTTASNGIDKVIAVNPICVNPMNVSISGVTIRFGRNTQPTSAPDFSYTGGGIDLCNTLSGGFTMTNVVVDQNTNTLGYGGGVNFDSFAANGTFAIVGSTVSGNRTLSTLGNNTGGGINLFGDQQSVNITNSVISGNTSAGEGGGVFVRHTNGGAITISGTTISGNTAASRGGGISNANLLASSLAILNDSAILNNVSQGPAALQSRGGGIFIFTGTAANTTTITETTFVGNQANTGTFQGGGAIGAIAGTVNATFNRIAGNLAGTGGGSGIHNAGATVNATNNWWGCNAGPGSAPCDRSINTSGTLPTAPQLTMRHSASPATIVVGQTSTLTADFLQNSTPAAVALANLDAMIGTSIAFNTAVRGTISAAQTTVQSNGTATATFTGTSVGAGSASSVVDSQTIAAAITISKANTTTTITSDLPDPSTVNAAVTVNYTVAVNAPGAGTPTGNVVVTASGGAETCTGTVAAGTCNITLTSAGARTLTATYSGDTNFTGSSDTEPHTVNDPPPTLSINDVSVIEGNAGTVTMTFTVTRTGTTPNAVSFNYATADNTATAPTDYVSSSGTGSIPSGGATGTTTISVTIKGDTLFEGNETFFVNLSAPVNATISDAQGIGTITNDDVALSVTTLTLPNPSTGVAYSQTVAASGGGGSYGFAVTAGSLPTGILLAPGGGLSGTTNQVGTFNFTITATDGNSQTASRSYTLTVAAPALTLTPAAGALTATFGVAYSQTFTAGGSAGPFSYVLTGALPGGLGLSGATLSGTPTGVGSFPITVTATDTVITGTGAPFSVARNYTLTVNATAPGAPTIGVATPGNAQASIAFTAPASNGGSAISTYTVTCNTGGFTATGLTSPITVSGLTNGTTYNCSVVATNGVGPGGASASVAVTPVAPTCAAGTWSVSGAAPCTPAAPGYFVATAGAMMQTACVPGTYQPASGQTACQPAQAGFYATGPAATAQLPCALGSTSAASAAVCTRLPLLNIDDSDAPDVYSPSTDGTLLLRYLLGLRGTALTAGTTGTNVRRNAAQIVTHIETYITLLDVDGDGQTRALTDGLMILRRMLGLSGSALTGGAKNSARTDDAVRDAIDGLKP